MRSVLFCLLLTGVLAAREIPASQVVKVDRREGFTVKTTGHTVSVAVVTLKGADKPQFLLVVETLAKARMSKTSWWKSSCR